MTGLLDTHAFIWWDSDPARLSANAIAFIRDPANSIAVSVTSVWEILIKSDLGKLKLTTTLREILDRQRANGISLLSISVDHVLQLERFPRLHKDPFDRLIAAQAAFEQMVLISGDNVFANYPVKVLW